MARFTSLLLLAAAALPFVFATQSADQCADSEFFYEAKTCCVPHGGVSNAPPPPQGSSQCPSDWYWDNTKACCLPPHPPTTTPQCGGSWSWNHGSSTCCDGGGSTTTTTPAPSANPVKSRSKPAHKRAATKARRSTFTCPDQLESCPISGLTGPTGDFECIDPQTELESCGGCASTGEGQDCTAIEGVWNVGCERGRCALYTCAQGYKLSADGTACEKL
ncbi:protein priA [Rhodofomes roseus]|uniref:Protein priA n=1 Tax=Rhodofomes roseus TaxID=34475 RepID=A0A4Y9Z5J3_9APHY|nr:protein priA [Rhodofomes roseus]KAH9835562.1 protein priA [Rhodofomes roseus]TFY69744.1 hypothetical protein EVJ58_g212 [Rhodofomes roseus]